ncbi:MAG: nickel-type superoxide dismutase maturation protease [Acidobacteria bacterium]|nr:nickel-type superoxide dismutase maturation protease [Acidobacteriota bacterium]
MEKELPDDDWFEELAYVCGFREIVRVEGDSMLPALKDGDLVLINPDAEPAVGDIVFARHPFKQSVKIIKRIAEILPDDRYILLGDNLDESTDSRSFGAIARKDILGKAEARIKPEKSDEAPSS